MTATQIEISAAADRLFAAQASAVAIPPVTLDLGNELSTAYAVQEELIRRRVRGGVRRIGRKVGLTAPAVQTQLGVDQPDFGVLLSDMILTEDDSIPWDSLISPRIEAEIAFVMNRDVTDTRGDSILDAVAYVTPAFEIVDSRIVDWKIGIVDTIADNASSAYFVLGQERARLQDYAPIDARMALEENGDEVSRGSGADCLGDPINALRWVAETAAALGRPLMAGEVVLSGALGPMVPLSPGSSYHAEISGLGSVSVTSSASERSGE
ncbi:MAG: 2-keto-4-pentenoate hydratase [Actinomycetota bacterium]|jgi:2-oxopent-4-enoate hydratase|nr:2-keto-4-pentenoate hydratase [Glaciihabitans sp.]MDQ1544902.1 2-keto-4-pentenoate hydratase [Actinomycetota bacterium]